jgi:3-oxoadipate enol-lactonase
MHKDWIEVNGARLRYRFDRGGGGTLVLLHEMGGTLESWDGVVAALGRGWSVLRYDQRGAGLSDAVAGRLTVDTAAGDLAALLGALAPEGPVAVAGAAVGAAVAIRFAVRHPERVGALALLAPATGIAPEQRAATLERIEKREAGEAPVSRVAGLRLDPGSYGATWRMLLDLDLGADFGAIACPTLVLAGAADLNRPPGHVAGIAGRIPGARFRILPTGHVMAIDTPGPVAAALAAFLAESGVGPAPPGGGDA